MASSPPSRGIDLRVARIRAHLSQVEVARCAGVSRQTIGRIEQQDRVRRELAARHMEALRRAAALRDAAS
jgi:DNA-binding XRE family transcriptional regulator